MSIYDYSISTIAARVGTEVDQAYHALGIPIFMSNNFWYDDVAQGAQLVENLGLTDCGGSRLVHGRVLRHEGSLEREALGAVIASFGPACYPRNFRLFSPLKLSPTDRGLSPTG